MGALDYLSNFCNLRYTKAILLRRRRRKPLQTVDLKVKMDCDGCERRVKHAVQSVRGVTSIEINRKQSRVIVKGYIDPNKVLRRVKKRTRKRVEFWPFIPTNAVADLHAAYDKRAPAGYVRNVGQAMAAPNAPEEQYITMFSDDNPNSCSIM